MLSNRYANRLFVTERHVLMQTIPGRIFARMAVSFLPEALCNDGDRAWLQEAVKQC